MNYIYLWIAIIVAILDWIAVARNLRKLEYFAKPAFMVLLLVWLGQNTGFRGSLVWFALGLLFSLAGDVFLMLPKNLFIFGLVSFLLGHLSYLAGFNSRLPSLSVPGVILALLIAGTAVQVFLRISAGLKAGGNNRLRTPILIYTIVISLMLLSALLTLVRSDWQPAHALAVSGGALLFFISDTILAWNRFVTPLPNGRVMNMITYQLGQLLIALGAASHFIS
jgi:alkenylglycerophosphocholine/alkenylglycerophosphoethanolamine hydrolase